MDLHGWIALGTLVAAVTFFITKWIPLEATALAIPVLLTLTGTIPASDALLGFGNHAVIALGGVFILGAAMKESGVATMMARGLQRIGGRREGRQILLVMLAGSILSGFMSNAATVAVFLPAVAALARRTGVPATRLMLPLAFSSILGGTLTLIGSTPNLLLGNELRRYTGQGLGMFEFTLVGAAIVATGILYMMTLGRRLLPRRTEKDLLREAPLPEEVARNYGVEERLFRLQLVHQSRIAGKTIRESGIGGEYDLEIVQVRRQGSLGWRYLDPTPELVLKPEDLLYVEGEAEAAWRFAEVELVQFGMADPKTLERLLVRGVALSEVTLSPRSTAFGRSFKELNFRRTHGLNVISLWRRGKAISGGTADTPLELGDAFLVSGLPAKLRELQEDPDYVVLTDPSAAEDVRRAPLAVAVLLLALLPPVLGWAPLAVTALGGALLMVGTGCISFRGARRAIDYRILFLVIGTIPLGIALESHGLAAAAAGALSGARLGPAAVLLVLFVVSALLSTTSNNAAAAVILAPVAAQVASVAGIPVAKAFLTVAYGTSCAFVIPFAHQCNLMVMGPGGYRVKDFLRAGSGLTVVMAVTTVTLLAIL